MEGKTDFGYSCTFFTFRCYGLRPWQHSYHCPSHRNDQLRTAPQPTPDCDPSKLQNFITTAYTYVLYFPSFLPVLHYWYRISTSHALRGPIVLPWFPWLTPYLYRHFYHSSLLTLPVQACFIILLKVNQRRTMKTPLVRKATGNHPVKSISLETTHSPVSGFCYVPNWAYDAAFYSMVEQGHSKAFLLL